MRKTSVVINCTENGPNLLVVEGKNFAAICKWGGSNKSNPSQYGLLQVL